MPHLSIRYRPLTRHTVVIFIYLLVCACAGVLYALQRASFSVCNTPLDSAAARASTLTIRVVGAHWCTAFVQGQPMWFVVRAMYPLVTLASASTWTTNSVLAT
jgi:hypothetical protein